jgi:hypothetical protein
VQSNFAQQAMAVRQFTGLHETGILVISVALEIAPCGRLLPWRG